MPAITLQRAKPVSRTFAEFRITHSWQEIEIYLRRLRGVESPLLTANGSDCTLRFFYRSHSFCAQERGNLLILNVDNATCPDRILFEVQSHLAALLSPELAY